MSDSHPDRPYFVAPPPDSDWSFGQPARPSLAHAQAHAHPPAASLRVAPTNRYEHDVGSYGDAPSAGAMLRAFATSSVLTWTSTALVMPFEVGKTLAQVQWVPRDGLTVELGVDHTDDALDEDRAEVSRVRWGWRRSRAAKRQSLTRPSLRPSSTTRPRQRHTSPTSTPADRPRLSRPQTSACAPSRPRAISPARASPTTRSAPSQSGSCLSSSRAACGT